MLDRSAGGRAHRVAAHLLAGFVFVGAATGQDAPPEFIEVTGTVVVEDRQGGEITDASGTITLGVHDDLSWGIQRALLVEGEWKARVERGCQLSFEFFSLDDGIAYRVRADGEAAQAGNDVSQDHPLPIPPDGRLAIRARYAPPCRLHVVDADTNAELDGIEVVREVVRAVSTISDLDRWERDSWELQRPIHPPEWLLLDPRAEKLSSPIQLSIDLDKSFPPIPRWTERVWIRASGHCWTVVSVDFRRGGDQFVQVPQSGTLEIEVAGAPLPRETKIVVRDASTNDRVLVWKYRPDMPAKFDGIRAERFWVSLEFGDESGGRVERFALCEVEVKTGLPALARLTVNETPRPPEPIQLAGTIRIPTEWGDIDFEIELAPNDVSALASWDLIQITRNELVRSAEDPGLWQLPERPLPPGTYLLQIKRFGVWRSMLIVRATLPLRLAIGAPIGVKIHTVDARTKAPLRVDYVAWFLADSEDRGGGRSLSWHTRSRAPGDSFTFRLPEGRIGLRTGVDGYDTNADVIIDVEAGLAEVTLPLRHWTGILVQFRIDGRPLTWKEALRRQKVADDQFAFSDYRPAVVSRDPAIGTGKADAAIAGGAMHGTRFFAVKAPGNYRVTFPPIRGYRPIEPRDVTIADQELTEVVIDLVRQ